MADALTPGFVGRRRSREDLPPPVPAAAVADAERRLGFALPPLLAAAYTTIGDGGFGRMPGRGGR